MGPLAADDEDRVLRLAAARAHDGLAADEAEDVVRADARRGGRRHAASRTDRPAAPTGGAAALRGPAARTAQALRRAAARAAPAGADLAARGGRRGGAGRRRRCGWCSRSTTSRTRCTSATPRCCGPPTSASTASATGRGPMPRSRCAGRPRPGRCSTGCWSCGCPTRSRWTATSSRACSSDGVAALATRGVDVLWPRSLGRELTASAVLDRSRPMSEREAQLRTGIFGEGELFSFRWQLAVHGDPLTDEEMDQLAASAAPLLRLRGNWTVIDPAIARKARKRVVRTATPAEAIAAALTGTVQLGTAEQPVEEQVQLGASLLRVRERLLHAARAGARRGADRTARHAPRLPAAGADLAGRAHLPRPRRLPGRRHGAGQDDHADRPAPAPRRASGHAGPTLVVCPASLLGNWEQELARFAPRRRGPPVPRQAAGRSRG